MRYLLVLGLAIMAFGQSVSITARIPKSEQQASILIRPRTTLLPLSCTGTAEALEPGESTTCTVTLSQAARTGGVAVQIVLPPELSGPSSVTVAKGATTAAFTATVNELSAAVTVEPGVLDIWADAVLSPRHIAVLSTPTFRQFEVPLK